MGEMTLDLQAYLYILTQGLRVQGPNLVNTAFLGFPVSYQDVLEADELLSGLNIQALNE